MFAAKLELKRRMTDSFVLQPVFDLMLELFGIVQRPDYDMRRQSILRRTDRPDVHMVHILDTRVGLRNGAPHVFAVDSDGHAVQRQAQAVVQQLGRGAIAMPTTGSIAYHPVSRMTIPDTSTPTDTSVSAAICR